MNMFKRRLTIILGLLFIIGGIGTCRQLASSKGSPPRSEPPAASRVVRTMAAYNAEVPVVIPITGRLRATDRMLINAEVGGTLQRTGRIFREGHGFRQGEVLFRIDNGEVRAQINAQQSAFLRTLVQLVPDLRLDMPSVARKWEDYLEKIPVEGELPPLPSLDTEQERNYLAGRGVLDQYYGIRALYERNSKYVITAPFDGVVLSAAVEPGTIVTPGTRLGEFIAPQSLELETAVGASELRFIAIGDTLRLHEPASGNHWNGRIIRLGEVIDAATQSIRVFVQVKGEGLRDGQYLAGSIHAGSLPGAVAVPRSALLEDGSLYIVRDSLLARASVQVLHQGVEQALVRGLSDGSQVVTDRMSGAYEGMRVTPLPGNAE
jgi:membrane fusion protein, multidrug efflux system